MAKTIEPISNKKPRKYQAKLTLYPMTFEQVVDTVLKYRPPKKKTKSKKPKAKPAD